MGIRKGRIKREGTLDRRKEEGKKIAQKRKSMIEEE